MKQPKPITIAVDFNGVIEDPSNVSPGKRWGNPMPGVAKALEDLHDNGFRIVVHTCPAHTPAGYAAVVEWLDYFDIYYDDVTAVKPVAALYLDDKGLHHTSWPDTLQQIERRLGVELDV